jgi:hypothetical protein
MISISLVKERVLRAYIAPLRKAISEGQDKKIRYYEPAPASRNRMNQSMIACNDIQFLDNNT